MDKVLIVLQNLHFSWGVAIVALVFLIRNAISSRDKHKKQIKAIRDETLLEVQNANDRANQLIQQYQIQCDAAIQHEHEAAANAIQHERELSAERIRQLQEQIEADKTSIMKKTEKEILADLTVSMSGFAKRLDRVESKLTPIEQEMELIVDKVDNIGVTVSDAQFHL